MLAVMPQYEPASALDRWAAQARARREQMDAQLAALGGPPEDWWQGRAAFFARGIGDRGAEPPFGLRQMVDRLDRDATVIDIGAGAGRYAVPLSRVVAHVTLVEPSAAMASHARDAFAAAGASNYTLVERAWPGGRSAADGASAVLMANVLGAEEDVRAFVEPALRRARRWLFIVHGSVGEVGESVGRVTAAFHGEPRIPVPGLSELLPALHEFGVYPDVVMGRRRFQRTYADLDDAARSLAAAALVAPTDSALRRIRGLVRRRLRRTDDGRLAEPPLDLPVGLLILRTGDADR